MDKYHLTATHISKLLDPKPPAGVSLLDLGCRDCILQRHLPASIDYSGLDLFQNDAGTVKYVQGFGPETPFDDGQFDFVVALDLLEHLDDAETGLQEMCRLSRVATLVMLPNMAHALFRFRFLLRGRLNGKYDMRYGAGPDRHRWLTVIPQMDRFVADFCAKQHYQHERVWFAGGRKQRTFAAVLRRLGFPASWWAWSSLYVIRTSPEGTPTEK